MNPMGMNMESSIQSFVPGFSSHNGEINKTAGYSQQTLTALKIMPIRIFSFSAHSVSLVT